MKHINENIRKAKEFLSSHYELIEKDTGEFREIKLNFLMKFRTQKYEIKDIGNLSVMTMHMGIMKMLSFVITPFEKNMPMLSMDYVFVMGNTKAYIECYDLVKNPQNEDYQEILRKITDVFQNYQDIADIPQKPVWYDTIRKVYAIKQTKDKKKAYALFADTLKGYISASEALPLLNADEKAEKIRITQEYCDNLVEKGGASTAIFKKSFGEEFTKKFFAEVMFGTDRE